MWAGSQVGTVYNVSGEPGPPLSKRLRGRGWEAIDSVMATMLAVGVGVYLVHKHGVRLSGIPGGPLIGYGMAIGATLPLAVRRRWPLAVLAGVLMCSVALLILINRTATATGATVALYTVAVRGPRGRSIAALAATEAGVVAVYGWVPTHPAGSATSAYSAALAAMVQLAVWLVGDGVARRRAYRAASAEQSARHAVIDERLRIARELHDVVAHGLSVIAVQAGVGRHVASVRPEEAAKALGAIEVASRQTLAEMRGLLSVLHTEDPSSAPAAPAPGLSDLESLVRQMDDAGLATALLIDGEARPLGAAVEVSAYRIVQEALTNIVKHARHARHAEVLVSYRDNELIVDITDDGLPVRNPGAPGPPMEACGHGLTGMRERATALGGRLDAGPRPQGGYRVTARLPMDASVR